MKRRKRKRSSKGGRPAKIPIVAEGLPALSTALAGADRQTHHGEEFITPVEVKSSGSDPTAFAGTDYVIDLGDELLATVEKEKLLARPSRWPGQTAGLIIATFYCRG